MNQEFKDTTAYGALLHKNKEASEFYDSCSATQREAIVMQPDNVPEIQGKAKHGKKHARPIIPGTEGPELKVYHQLKGDGSVGDPTP